MQQCTPPPLIWPLAHNAFITYTRLPLTGTEFIYSAISPPNTWRPFTAHSLSSVKKFGATIILRYAIRRTLRPSSFVVPNAIAKRAKWRRKHKMTNSVDRCFDWLRRTSFAPASYYRQNQSFCAWLSKRQLVNCLHTRRKLYRNVPTPSTHTRARTHHLVLIVLRAWWPSSTVTTILDAIRALANLCCS